MVYQHLPVVAFRRSPNLRDLLVTAKLSSNSANPQLPPGSFCCGNLKLRHLPLHFSRTHYIQYKGETKRRLKDRSNGHRRTIDNPDAKFEPTTAAKHFLSSPNHTANDMQLIPVEKIFSNRDSIRKTREAVGRLFF